MCSRIVNIWPLLLLTSLVQGTFQGCDEARNIVSEGRLGTRLSDLFPWMGVLRPIHPRFQNYLHRFGKGGIMVVMVKQEFAVGVADELMRLPKYLFKGYASITFQSGGVRSYKIAACLPHPEYDEDAEEGTTINALAVLHLQSLDPADIILKDPIVPICLRSDVTTPQAAQLLYTVLYEYDNMNSKFEKAIYSMDYMDKESCQEFYMKGGVTDQIFEPISLQCAYARNLPRGCVWEAGVALVSNATGPWLLMGLGTKSLGCANPTRFIDLVPYVPWIEAITASDRWQFHLNRRFALDKRGHLRQTKQGKNEVPLELPWVERILQNNYPFDTARIHDPFKIFSANDSQVYIIPVPGELGDCNDTSNELVYREETRVLSPSDGGTLAFKVTIFDDFFLKISCTKIAVISTDGNDNEGTIWFDKEIQNKEGGAFTDIGETPEEILNPVYLPPLKPQSIAEKDKKDDWTGPPLKPKFLQDLRPIVHKPTYNLMFRLQFLSEAVLQVDVLGKAEIKSTTVTITTEEPESIDSDPNGEPKRRYHGNDVTEATPMAEQTSDSGEELKRILYQKPERNTWSPITRIIHNKGRLRPYELYKMIEPETAELKSAAEPTRIQLVFLVICIFATWLLYLMHYS